MEKEKTILDYDTVALDEAQDAVIIMGSRPLTPAGAAPAGNGSLS